MTGGDQAGLLPLVVGWKHVSQTYKGVVNLALCHNTSGVNANCQCIIATVLTPTARGVGGTVLDLCDGEALARERRSGAHKCAHRWRVVKCVCESQRELQTEV